MAFRNKIYFLILGIIIRSLFFTDIRAEEVQPSDNATGQEIVTAPEQHDMSLVSFSPWVVEGEVLGAVAEYVYDDVTTERPSDYWELYNKEGDLLAISWFDRFGIKRTAVDRGIVEERDQLDGIFVEWHPVIIGERAGEILQVPCAIVEFLTRATPGAQTKSRWTLRPLPTRPV